MILGTIFSEYIIEDSDDINQKTQQFLYSLKEYQPNSDTHSNRKGWQKNELQNLPQMQPLIDEIKIQFESFIETKLEPIASCKFYLGNLFCNINPPGAYNLPHIHEGDFTGVYYVKAPINSGKICFVNPQQCASTAKMCSLFKNIKLEEKIEPKSGHGYFFPTYLNHYVEENMSNEDRISISYNINISRS